MVQGVGFRWFVRETARRLDLAGWVKNRQDGAVELAVDGPTEMIELFLRDVSQGPPGARVQSVEHLPVDGLDPLTHPFTVHRS